MKSNIQSKTPSMQPAPTVPPNTAPTIPPVTAPTVPPQKASSQTPPPTIPPIQITNAMYVYNTLTGKGGYTKEQAVGIIANLSVESAHTFDPEIVQGTGRRNPALDPSYYGSAGYGIAQWTEPSRQKALTDYAATTNRPVGDIRVQTDFLIKELDSMGIDSKIKSTTTAGGASSVFLKQYEKPAEQLKNDTTRAALANKYLEQLGSTGYITPSPNQREADASKGVGVRKFSSGGEQIDSSEVFDLGEDTNEELMQTAQAAAVKVLSQENPNWITDFNTAVSNAPSSTSATITPTPDPTPVSQAWTDGLAQSRQANYMPEEPVVDTSSASTVPTYSSTPPPPAAVAAAEAMTSSNSGWVTDFNTALSSSTTMSIDPPSVTVVPSSIDTSTMGGNASSSNESGTLLPEAITSNTSWVTDITEAVSGTGTSATAPPSTPPPPSQKRASWMTSRM